MLTIADVCLVSGEVVLAAMVCVALVVCACLVVVEE